MKKNKFILIILLIISLIVPIVPSMGTVEAASYSIRVNKGTNVVTVYQNGNPIKAFICSTGSATPLGTFGTSQKLRWHELQGKVYGQYCTRITGSILFHSVWYYENYNKASQSHSAYNNLGSTASAGCVRLTVADAKWIYDNCPLGTPVTVFYGGSSGDPLGKPTAIKVNPNVRMGWDPTDPDPANPYAANNPTISYQGKKEVNVHSKFDPKAGIVAKDSLGNNISSRVSVSGSVNTGKLGSYNLAFSVTDSIGRSASTSVTIQVVDKNKPVFSGIMKSKKIEYGKKLNIKKNVKAKSYAGSNLTSKIKIYVKAPGAKEKIFKGSVYTFKKLGNHKIRYYVKNSKNGKSTTKTITLNVVDTKKPTLKGVPKNKVVQYGTSVNLVSGVKASASTGANLTKYIKTSVKAPGTSKYSNLKTKKTYKFSKLGTFTVKYTVKNPKNKKSAQKTFTVKVVDTKKPTISNIPGNQTLQYGTAQDISTSVKAVAATGVNLKKNVVISVKAPGSSKYVTFKNKIYTFNKLGKFTIKYDVTNPKNKKTQTKSRVVTVVDTQVPVLSGIMASRQVEYNSTLDMKSAVKAVSGAKENLTSSIVVTMKKPSQTSAAVLSTNNVKFDEVGAYVFNYSVKNANNGKTTQKSITITVVDSSEPEILGVPSEELPVAAGTDINLMTGITARTKAGGVNLTNQVNVAVTEAPPGVAYTLYNNVFNSSVAGTFKITYKVTYNNREVTAQRIIEVN